MKLFTFLTSVLSLKIFGSIKVPKEGLLHAHLLLDSYQIIFLKTGGNFSLDLSTDDGFHILQIISHSHVFDRYKIDFLNETTPVFKPFPLGYNESPFTKELDNLYQIEPLARYDYSEVKSQFSIFSALGNPMLLMSFATIAIIYFMPKLKDSMVDSGETVSKSPLKRD